VSSPEERPGATDSPEAEVADELALAPIPAEGTTAPPDADRVFARPPASSPYARIVTAASVHDSGQGVAQASDDSRSDQAGSGDRLAVQNEGAGGAGSSSPGGTPGNSPGGTSSGGSASGSGGTPSSGSGGRFGGSGGPGTPSGPTAPHPQPPTGDELKRIRNRGRLAILFGLTGLVASVLAFPLGLLLGIAAIVCGVIARRASRRTHVTVPGATPGLLLGVVATVFASILTATAVVFWDEVVEYQQCYSGANTQTARESCQQRLEERIVDRIGPLSSPR
jgi:hypothetical protein